jgi:hypothetical protein
MLARQGDLDGAIQLLRDSPLATTASALRALLADLYVQKAEALKLRQPDAARAAVEAALAIDRRHAGALALQQQLLPATRPRVQCQVADPGYLINVQAIAISDGLVALGDGSGVAGFCASWASAA